MEAAKVRDAWDRGDSYERYVGRWSRSVARSFLSWLSVPGGRRWLDVGCGTGALSECIAEACAPSRLLGLEPSGGFIATAAARLASGRLDAGRHDAGPSTAGRPDTDLSDRGPDAGLRGAKSVDGQTDFVRGSATRIPLRRDSADVTVSGLALNFFPDTRQAVEDMARVTTETVAAYVWDYAGKMDLMRFFWDEAGALDPRALPLDEGVRFPVCRPDALEALFREAGLTQVAVTAIEIPTPFTGFEDYWQPFLGGQGPAPSYLLSLDDAARERLRKRLRERMASEKAVAEDGSILLSARAWAVRGDVPRRGGTR